MAWGFHSHAITREAPVLSPKTTRGRMTSSMLGDVIYDDFFVVVGVVLAALFQKE